MSIHDFYFCGFVWSKAVHSGLYDVVLCFVVCHCFNGLICGKVRCCAFVHILRSCVVGDDSVIIPPKPPPFPRIHILQRSVTSDQTSRCELRPGKSDWKGIFPGSRPHTLLILSYQFCLPFPPASCHPSTAASDQCARPEHRQSMVRKEISQGCAYTSHPAIPESTCHSQTSEWDTYKLSGSEHCNLRSDRNFSG